MRDAAFPIGIRPCLKQLCRFQPKRRRASLAAAVHTDFVNDPERLSSASMRQRSLGHNRRRLESGYLPFAIGYRLLPTRPEGPRGPGEAGQQYQRGGKDEQPHTP